MSVTQIRVIFNCGNCGHKQYCYSLQLLVWSSSTVFPLNCFTSNISTKLEYYSPSADKLWTIILLWSRKVIQRFVIKFIFFFLLQWSTKNLRSLSRTYGNRKILLRPIMKKFEIYCLFFDDSVFWNLKKNLLMLGVCLCFRSLFFTYFFAKKSQTNFENHLVVYLYTMGYNYRVELFQFNIWYVFQHSTRQFSLFSKCLLKDFSSFRFFYVWEVIYIWEPLKNKFCSFCRSRCLQFAFGPRALVLFSWFVEGKVNLSPQHSTNFHGVFFLMHCSSAWTCLDRVFALVPFRLVEAELLGQFLVTLANVALSVRVWHSLFSR